MWISLLGSQSAALQLHMSQERGLAVDKLEDWVGRCLVWSGRQCLDSNGASSGCDSARWRLRGVSPTVAIPTTSFIDARADLWFVVLWRHACSEAMAHELGWMALGQADTAARAKPGHTKAFLCSMFTNLGYA